MNPPVPPAEGLFTSARFAAVMRELEPLAERFAAAGHRLFLVGGSVRDLVASSQGFDVEGFDVESLDVEGFDLDATTTAHPPEIKRLLEGWADAIWTQGERFGTIGAMKLVAGPGVASRTGEGEVLERVFEITTHRAEAYRGDSRKPEVAFSDDIQADLSRRDFTVNAMAIDVTAAVPTLVDPFGGSADLVGRALRTPLTPVESFSDDPLRMLRAARFIARYDLVPAPDLVHAARTMGERLAIVSAERIRGELDKLLAAPAPLTGLQFVADTGLVRHALPEVAALVERTIEMSVHPNGLAHAIAVASGVPVGDRTRRLTRWAALLALLGTEVAQGRMRHLRDSIAHIDGIGTLVAIHERLVAHPVGTMWADREVRCMIGDAGDLLQEAIVMARTTAEHLQPEARDRVTAGVSAFEDRMATLAANEDLGDLRPELDGASVMELLELTPGRQVGAALKFLTDLRLEIGPVGTDEATRRLLQWWAAQST